MITEEHTKEMLSVAYIKAIAGIAGVNLSYDYYDYGVDGTFKPVIRCGDRLCPTGFSLDFQLKSTVNWEIKDDQVIYDLEVKNYNDMARRHNGDYVTPIVLILLCLPEEKDSWINISDDKLIMKKCCYWYYINSEPSENLSSVRIKIPTSNLFTPIALNDLLSKVEGREM